MIEVTATRTVKRPMYQTFQSQVKLNGYDRLTPKAARGALEVAFGNANGGDVWWPEGGYGYRVYGKSARKLRYEGE